jgi:hypothetical protein
MVTLQRGDFAAGASDEASYRLPIHASILTASTMLHCG